MVFEKHGGATIDRLMRVVQMYDGCGWPIIAVASMNGRCFPGTADNSPIRSTYMGTSAVVGAHSASECERRCYLG